MARIKPQALLQQSKKKKGPSGIGVAAIAIYVMIVIVMTFFLFASYRHWTRRSKFHEEDMTSGIEHDGSFIDTREVHTPKYAVISTSKGTITVELYTEGSSEVVDEFMEACEKEVFKGMLFNRVIKNFVIQGGDVNRPGVVEDWSLSGKHDSQLDTSVKHVAFMLGTSKTKHDGGGFDIFITTAPILDLKEKMNVFGRVIKGEEVVQEIEEVDTDELYQPKTPIGIIDVSLKQEI